MLLKMCAVDLKSTFIIGFLLLCYTANTLALECYFCAATGENSPCEKYDNYKRAASCKAEGFRKNCSSDEGTMCTIESHRINGVNIVQIRGCNDGNTFYLTSPNITRVNLDKLRNFSPGNYRRTGNKTYGYNETRCAYDGQYLICLTKCNTSYCNGPRLDMQACGGVVQRSSAFVLFIMVLLVFAVIRSEDCGRNEGEGEGCKYGKVERGVTACTHWSRRCEKRCWTKSGHSD